MKYDGIRIMERFFVGEATKEEKEYLLKQLNIESFEEDWLKEQWLLAPEGMNVVVQKRMYSKVWERMVPKRKPIFFRWSAVAAAVLALFILTVSVYVYRGVSNNGVFGGDVVVTVQKGQKASITLADGSRVWLNSGSKLSYGSRYNSKERVLNLEGEACFEAAKNGKAPFVVRSHGISVKALGTVFNVRAYAEDKRITVTLVKGKVEVGDGVDKILLHPNQQAEYDIYRKNFRKMLVENGSRYTDWRENRMCFDAMTFEEIASELERHYNVRLVFESEALKRYRYSGTLSNTSLDGILQLLAMTSPLIYRMEDSTIYLGENEKTKSLYVGVVK